MKFALAISLKNIRQHPGRTAAVAGIVALLGFTLFAGSYLILGLRRGLSSYQDRLGADIVVIPASARGHGSVDDILLQGITGNDYMSGKEIEKVAGIEGIARMSCQLYLTSAKASCCSTRVQIVGFDPETDFSIQPWIRDSFSDQINDGDVVIGANINLPVDYMVRFYGKEYRVVAQLAETGTGLDSAVYANMNTVRQMAESAANLLETNPFQGVDINTAASAIMIKVADGYTISDVTDDINIHITKVEATAAKSMVSDIAEGLGKVSSVITVLIEALFLLAIGILGVVQVLLANERKKEFGILRVMGASKSMLSLVNGTEAGILSLGGAALGTGLAVLFILPFMGLIRNAMGLPLMNPGIGSLILLVILSILLSGIVGMMVAHLSASRITGKDTGLLIRTDA